MKKLFVYFPISAAIIIIAGLVIGGGIAFRAWRAAEIYPAVSLTNIKGVVEIKTTGCENWQPVVSGGDLHTGDSIRTSDFSSVTLVFFDGSQTSLYPNTIINVSELSGRRDGRNKAILLSQWLGQTLNRVERLLDPASRFEIETPTAVTAVRGTEFTVQVADDGSTQVEVKEGVVDVTAQGTTVKVKAEQFTTVNPEEPPAPVEPASISPEGASPFTLDDNNDDRYDGADEDGNDDCDEDGDDDCDEDGDDDCGENGDDDREGYGDDDREGDGDDDYGGDGDDDRDGDDDNDCDGGGDDDCDEDGDDDCGGDEREKMGTMMTAMISN